MRNSSNASPVARTARAARTHGRLCATDAANDAHAALRAYTKLIRRAQAAGLGLRPVARPAKDVSEVTFVVDPSATAKHGSAVTVGSSAPEPQRSSPPGTHEPPARAQGGTVYVTSWEQLRSSERQAPVRSTESQILRAYTLWHEEQMPLPAICSALRSAEHPLPQCAAM